MANPKPPLENLRPRPPWKPGQSGNPNGYSRNRRMTSALRDLDDRTDAAAAVARVLTAGALRGDIAFIREFNNRLDGKVAEPPPDPDDAGDDDYTIDLSDDEDDTAQGQDETAA